MKHWTMTAAASLAAVLFAHGSEAAGRPCEPAHVVGGGAGYCAIRNDGRVACWGDEFTFLPYAPAPPAGRFKQVSIGGYSACGVRDDDRVVCWGEDAIQVIPTIDGEARQVSVGLYGVDVIRPDQTLDYIPLQDSEHSILPGTFDEISHGCARRTDGTIACPDGVTAPEGKFERVAGQCGIREGGKFECWGDWQNLAADVQGLYRDLSSTGEFSPIIGGYAIGFCAVRQDGDGSCWGDDIVTISGPDEDYRELAYGYGWPWGLTTDGRLVPWAPWDIGSGRSGPVVGPFTQISAGGDGFGVLTCGLKPSGRAECWGHDGYEQASPPDLDFTQVGAGTYHGCGLRTDGTIKCWGNENYLKNTEAPAGQFEQISTGYFGPNCALRTNGTVACWGYNEEVLDVPAGTFASVSAGGERACALNASGVPTCWRYVEGDTQFDVVMENVNVPAGTFAEVEPYFNANATIRDSHFCGRRSNGTVECWTDESGVTPWTPPAGKFTKLSKGGGFPCGIRSTGHIECWGPDWLDDYLSPPEGEFVQAVAGAGHVCGLTADGTVVCTGSDQTVSVCGPSLLCGNGDLDDSETCDDGDQSFVPGDACTAGCWSVPCGQPIHPEAEGPVASDALFTLRAAVGSSMCSPAVCDVDASSIVSAIDALIVLRRSVGTGAPLACS